MNTTPSLTPRIFNRTPHSITIVRNGTPLTIPPSGQVARVTIERKVVANLSIGGIDIPVEVPVFGAITGLPEPEEGVIHIVSRTVCDRARRADVVRVNGKLRDGQDRIIGATDFATCPVIR